MRNSYRFHLPPGHAIHLGQSAGELRVVEGQVWLTLHGEHADHFITPGGPLQLDAQHGAVLETGRREHAVVLWRPEVSWAARIAAGWLHLAAMLMLRVGRQLRRAARVRQGGWIGSNENPAGT